MLTTMLYPEIVTKLVVWNIVGGIYGIVRARRATTSCRAFSRSAALGMEGLLQRGRMERAHRGEPAQQASGSSALDTDEFLKVMLRWLNAFVSKPGQTIPGVPRTRCSTTSQVPTLIIRGGENDWDHPKRTSLEVSCLIKGSKLIDPPWPEDAWERAARTARRARSSTSTCSTPGCRPRPRSWSSWARDAAHIGANVHLAVERRLQRGVDAALRNPVEVGLAQRHVRRCRSRRRRACG